MTTFTVSFQGFTFTNRLLGMKLLSHHKGAPHFIGTSLGYSTLNPLFIGITGEGAMARDGGQGRAGWKSWIAGSLQAGVFRASGV